jgi:pSer/pThr/pTyr-binding forkhead associated (FHA) protein
MQVELHLVGTEDRWLLSTPRIRLGRDPGCEVPLPPERYPMVSREHAVLTLDNGRIHLTDSQSTNGTWVNGSKVPNAMLTRLDRFRLGKDGPEFEITIMEEQPAASAPTRLSVDPAASAQTMIAADPAILGSPTRAAVARAGVEAATPTRIAKPAEQEKALTMVGSVSAAPRRAEESRPITASVVQRGPIQENEQMIEQKLNSLRNLVYLLVAMVAVLLGVIFYQSQQIDKNRAELGDMRKQAQGAVAQFTPALDQRLNAFDQRLDQMDSKMKTTEDEFMTRLNNELPKMLDKYVDRKVKQLSAAAPQLPEQR